MESNGASGDGNMDISVKNGDTLDSNFSDICGSSRDSTSPVQLPTTRDAEEYNMNHKNRGKCIIINNRVFEPHTDLDERFGTDVDAENLSVRFSQLSFKVERHNNKTAQEMRNILNRAGKDDYTDDDCIVCCILTHGGPGFIYGIDGKLCVDDVFSPFTADVCRTLAGKPKMFFIQACRGDKVDKGLKVTPRLAVDGGNSSSLKIPTHADFLMAFSTVPGFYSWRCSSNGSWFIQGLCSVLQERSNKMDVFSMMTHVNRFVAYTFESNIPKKKRIHKMKQVPYITSTLTRQVFLYPKVVQNPV